jgi:hypothetical protein
MMKHITLALLFISLFTFGQQGGMWIPSLLEGMNEKEMKSLGFQLKAKDIYDINQSSFKDAVPHFNNGCTSEIISSKGLLLTNHHCGYSQIQSHSTVDKDYLQDGFWAMNFAEELPNKNLTVTFMVKIDDVTKLVLDGTSALKSEKEIQDKIQANIANLTSTYKREMWQDVRIRAFFEGNQYYLFVVETFKDVRLVGAPPSSIGKFGSDTDNWMWPRHTGDFALFRIYADKNNRPAEYSKDNVPYTPKHFFPVSTGGIKEGDFTMVFGYPGRTQEYLPAVAVKQIVEVLNPVKIDIRDAALKVQDGFMRKDQAIKIKYAAKYASVANAWKKWIGENKGLKKSDAIAIKKKQEGLFMQNVTKASKHAEYGGLLSDFETLFQEIEPYALSRDCFQEVVMRHVEFLNIGYRLYQLEQVHAARGNQAFEDRKKNLVASLEGFFKNYDEKVDEKVFEKLIQIYAEKTPVSFLPENFQQTDFSLLTKNIFAESKLTSKQGVYQLLNGNFEEVTSRLNQDVGYLLVKKLSQIYHQKTAPKFDELQLQINALQRTYMKGIIEFSKPEDRIFPDANSTLRVTYGQVKGYDPADAIRYDFVSHLEGVIEKYVPNDYEFDVPKKLLDLYNKKDFGAYADKNGKMPVCFIATNHTTGGNSGSPALNKKGHLIGLNFDRVWEGTMSDIYYDPKICRNIMVDARYILFIIDKYAGAKHLIEEMKLVK